MTYFQHDDSPGIRTLSAVFARARLLAGLALVAGLATACDARNASQPLANVHEIISPTAPGSSAPGLFVAGDGRVLMSWAAPLSSKVGSKPGVEDTVRYAVLEVAAAAKTDKAVKEQLWSAPRTVAVSALLAPWATSVVALPDGTLAASWLQRRDSENWGVHVHLAQSLDGGRTWSEDLIPHRDLSGTEHAYVSLFPFTDNKLGVVWLDGRQYDKSDGVKLSHPASMLRFTTLTDTGRRSADVALDGRVCDCCTTGAAMTSKGLIVVYRNRSAKEVRDIYAIGYVDGHWTKPEPVHRDGWVIDACPVNGPAVAAQGRHVAVAWYAAPDQEASVRVALSLDAGASFGPAVRVDDGAPLGRVDVVMLQDGAALVSWLEEQKKGPPQIRVRRVEPTPDTSAPPTAGPSMVVTAASSARGSGYPMMVRAGEQVVFAWTVPGEPSQVHVAVAAVR